MLNENPWLSVWLNPRNTIRTIIVDNPNRSLWLLATIYGFTSLLNLFQSFPSMVKLGVFPLVSIAMVFAPFWGYAFFTMWSWVIVKVGHLLGGKATMVTARAAYAWSCVPFALSLLIWLLLIILFYNFLFFGQYEKLSPSMIQFAFLLLVGKLVLSIWSIVLYLQMLSVVQQFSVLRAIANVFLSSLALLVFGLSIWFVAGYVMEIMISH